MAGHDTVVLLPTGGGKSAIYQLAGIERPGGTVVVSPLLALQQDQLESLRELGLSAAALSSAVSESEREAALAAFERGELEFLLLAPEQLADGEQLGRIARGRPSLLVVDEAHCVSEWGPDFRPEYRRLGAVRLRLGGPPILALTATASPPVREDIARWLGLRDPVVVARGFDRPEILLGVQPVVGERAKRTALLGWVLEQPRPGIVYVATRRSAEAVAGALADEGLRAASYHAGQPGRRRAETVDAFMADELEAVVATIAFGLGIDKPNVRWVAHHDPSDSLEAYHQEIGRAGRDGEPAQARLFFDAADLGLRRFQTIPPPLPRRETIRIVRRLADGPAPPEQLVASGRLSRRRTDQVVGRLEELGLATVEPDGLVRPTGALDGTRSEGRADPDSIASDVVEAQERRRRHAGSRVELLRGYAETQACRGRFLLNALGEELDRPCGHCDNDVRASTRMPDLETAPFRLGDAVVHTTFGAGEVARIEADRVVVRFESVGYRTLALDAVLEPGLLAKASA